MMKKIVLLSSAVMGISLGVTHAQTTPVLATVVATCGTPPTTYTAGQQKAQTQNTGGQLCTGATITPSGTQDVNIIQTGGVTQLRGAGAVGTGSERVAIGQDTTTIAGSAPGTAAAPSANVLTIVDVPSAASSSGVAPVQSSAVETGHVIKASAGNLYDFNVSADSTLAAAAWEVLIFNSTTVPASGAVTPVKCYIAPAGTTSVSGAFPTPMYLGTGISIAVSTATTCFTKTDSAHGFISADAQ